MMGLTYKPFGRLDSGSAMLHVKSERYNISSFDIFKDPILMYYRSDNKEHLQARIVSNLALKGINNWHSEYILTEWAPTGLS